MKLKACLTIALVLVFFALPGFAQEQKQPQMTAEQKAQMDAWMKYATPGEGHKLLEGLIGTWDTKVSMWEQPGGQPQVSTGTSTYRWILGNRFVEQRFTGTFMGMPFEGIGYSGYDNAKKEYFGTWMDSMSTGLMMSTGNTSDKGKTWTFHSTMTDPMTGKDVPGETRMTVTDPDHNTFEMFGAGPDGKKFKMMEIVYSRKK